MSAGPGFDLEHVGAAMGLASPSGYPASAAAPAPDAEGLRRPQSAGIRTQGPNASAKPNHETGWAPEVPPSVYLVAVGLLVWFVAAAAAGFGGGQYAPIVFGVCALFTGFSLGMPALLAALASRRDRGQGETVAAGRAMERLMPTASGGLRRRDAVIQILSIPASVSLGITLMAAVKLLVA